MHRMVSVAPIASIVTVLPVMSRISSSFGIAPISFVFSGIGICAATRLVAASRAFKIYGAFLSLIFSAAALSAFPSITICIPFVPKIFPIQSVNARASSSSSTPQAVLENVESESMPFFRARCFFSFSWFLSAHFTMRRREGFPARKSRTISSRTSTWLCLCFRAHRISPWPAIQSLLGTR